MCICVHIINYVMILKITDPYRNSLLDLNSQSFQVPCVDTREGLSILSVNSFLKYSCIVRRRRRLDCFKKGVDLSVLCKLTTRDIGTGYENTGFHLN